MADRSTRRGFGLIGVGAATCAACCAGPGIAFLTTTSVGALAGVALFGGFGIAVAVIAIVLYLGGRSRGQKPTLEVPITLGRKPDA